MIMLSCIFLNNRSNGMGIIIMGVKLDDVMCECIKFVVICIDCILYWLIK